MEEITLKFTNILSESQVREAINYLIDMWTENIWFWPLETLYLHINEYWS